MRHPSEYTTTPLLGLHLMVVDAGTEVKDERTGETVVIDDKTCAQKGSVLWCTQVLYDKLKRNVQ